MVWGEDGVSGSMKRETRRTNRRPALNPFYLRLFIRFWHWHSRHPFPRHKDASGSSLWFNALCRRRKSLFFKQTIWERHEKMENNLNICMYIYVCTWLCLCVCLFTISGHYTSHASYVYIIRTGGCWQTAVPTSHMSAWQCWRKCVCGWMRAYLYCSMLRQDAFHLLLFNEQGVFGSSLCNLQTVMLTVG